MIYINTDGGSRGNPGPAGCGAVITDEKGNILKKASKFLGVATNNEAEYQAVILGLETLKKMFGSSRTVRLEVRMRMDSELVCRQLSGTYQIKEPKLFPAFMKIWNLRVTDFPNFSCIHIRREENNIADGLANEAMDGGTQDKLL